MIRVPFVLLFAAAACGFALPAAAQSAGARDLSGYVWEFQNDEAGPALFLLPADGGSGEPDIPFLMRCPPVGDWTIAVSDIDATALGGAIARGDRVTFRLVRILAGARIEPEYPRDFFPTISFGEMYGTWDFEATWTQFDGLLEDIVQADQLAVEGTGLGLLLPVAKYGAAVDAFAAACADVAARIGAR